MAFESSANHRSRAGPAQIAAPSRRCKRLGSWRRSGREFQPSVAAEGSKDGHNRKERETRPAERVHCTASDTIADTTPAASKQSLGTRGGRRRSVTPIPLESRKADLYPNVACYKLSSRARGRGQKRDLARRPPQPAARAANRYRKRRGRQCGRRMTAYR